MPAKKPAATPPAADPRTAEVAKAIRSEASGKLKAFYAPRGFWPLWVKDGAIDEPTAKAFLAYLSTADLDDLDPRRYGVDRLRRAIDEAHGGPPEAVAKAEIRLSETFAAYLRDIRKPAPDVRITYLDAELQPGKMREDAVLRTAALAPSFAAYVKAMGWMSPLYVTRRAALGKYLAGHGSGSEERLLRLNLDRARLLPGPWTRHVVVDAASARLWYFADGKQQGTMRVVVGAPESQTPMLAGVVRYAILNPYWNVPTDLVQKRIAPKVLGGQSLRALRYEVLSDWGANATKIDPKSVDWQAVADGRQELRLRQLPGGANAMGKVKFMFPNDLGIYLHDTPEKALLAKPGRHFSNGCIRLEDAQRLGRWFFGKPLAPKPGEPEQHVPLPEPVPVYLTYLTAAPTAKGVTVLEDVYGRDRPAG